MNEAWNSGGAVTEAEENDHNMTAEERLEAITILQTLIIDTAVMIRNKLIVGAPCAAEKSLSDLDMASDCLEFIWERVKDWKKVSENE